MKKRSQKSDAMKYRMKNVVRYGAWVVLFTLVFNALELRAQESKVLGYRTFIQQVQQDHPMVQVSELKIASGEATLLSAKGAFDPKVQASYGQKEFDNKKYYQLQNAGVKLPTWLGVTVAADYLANQGVFLNPENFTTNQGILQGGLELTLGNGLFIDERRAELKKARIAQEMAEQDRRMILNQLQLDASLAYWKWSKAYYSKEIREEAVDIAQIRLTALKSEVVLGETAGIDTLEASIQLKTRVVELEAAILEEKNMRAYLSLFLWLDGELPLEVEEETRPESAYELSQDTDVSWLINTDQGALDNHPALIYFDREIDQMDIDRRLRLEQLKPTLDLKYNALRSDAQLSDQQFFNAQDYVVGVDFSLPILLRKERGALRKAEIQIDAAEIKLDLTKQKLWIQSSNSRNSWFTLQDQINTQRRIAADYQSLADAERTLFDIGESSLFLVNAREMQYIGALLKSLDLEVKLAQTLAEARYHLGLIE